VARTVKPGGHEVEASRGGTQLAMAAFLARTNWPDTHFTAQGKALRPSAPATSSLRGLQRKRYEVGPLGLLSPSGTVRRR
jgi:hypothetical protein